MMKVKAGVLLNPNFIPAFSRMSGKAYPPKVAYSILKTSKKIDSEIKRLRDLQGKILDKYKFFDHEGKPDPAFVETEEFKKETAEFVDIDVELDCWPIHIDDLNHDVSVSDLAMLEPFLTEVKKEEVKPLEIVK